MVKDKKHLYHIIDMVVESPKSRAILKDAVDDYSSALLRQTDVSGSLRALDDETAATPIQDALYATGSFSTDDCSNLADGILQYIKDAKMSIVGRQ